MTRRLLWLIILVFILAPTVFNIGAVIAQDSVLGTTITEIWLRSGPGTHWRRIETVPANTTVAVDGRDITAGWIHVITSGGSVGWMSVAYVTLGDFNVLNLRYVPPEAGITVAAPVQGSGPAVASGGGGAGAQGTPTNLTATVNIRSGPSTNYRVVGVGAQGITFLLDGRDGLLEWVRGITPEGTIGWVSVDFITLSYNEIAALNIVGVGTPFTLSPGSGGAPAQSSDDTSVVGSPVNIQPVVSTAPVTGFSYGGHVADFSNYAADVMRGAGMTWVKRQYRYSQGQDPGVLSGMINDAHARGFRILIGIVGHVWEVNNPGYYDQYAAFVGGAAALGADAIEVWNEQNIDREWPAGFIDPGRYTQLLAQSYNAIKSNNSNTLVISGALAPTGFFGGCSPNGCDDAPYIAGMAASGAANYMDCLGIHYNEGIVPPSQTSGDPRSEHYTRYFWGMINTYWSAFGGRRPLCFTELGYLSPEGYGPLPGHFGWAANTSVAEHAAWLGDAVRLSRSSGRVRLLIIWNVDFTIYGEDPMGGYAMIRPGGDCPACRAIAGG